MNRRIQNLSFLCACLIVFIHVPGVDVNGGNGMIWRFVRFGLAECAVPFFFIVSGFFLAKHFGEEEWWRCSLRSRVRSLVIPYVVWCLMFFCIDMAFGLLADMMYGQPFGTRVPLVFDPLAILGLNPARLPALGAYWYVRTLLILVLMSPALKWLVCRLGAWSVVALGAFMVVCKHMELPFLLRDVFSDVGMLAPRAMLYFTIGLYLRGHSLQVRRWHLPVAFILAVTVYCACSRTVYMEIGVPLMLASMWAAVPDCSWPKWLTANAFCVYTLHPFVLRVPYELVLPKWFMHNPTCPYVIWVVVVAISLCLALAMKQFLPRCSEVAFGAR